MDIAAVTLRSSCPDSDRGLLERWVRAPHVARWWGDPGAVLQEALDVRSAATQAIIEGDGVRVGYIQWQVAPRHELDAAGLSEVADGTVDIDILIGEPDYLGRGVAPRALRLVTDRLRMNPGVPLVMLATSVANRSALRAFEKAGF